MKTYSLFAMLLFLFSCNMEKETDWTTRFSKHDKEPYGCYIAYQSLQDLFPNSTIKKGTDLMGQINKANKSLNTYATSGNIIIVVCSQFKIDSADFQKMLTYAEKGNVVCLFADKFSKPISNYFSLKVDTPDFKFPPIPDQDTGRVQELSLLYQDSLSTYTFHGVPLMQQSLDQQDSLMGEGDSFDPVLGHYDTMGKPNLIIRHMQEGAFMLGTSPLTFSNYFLLQAGNKAYYENLLSWYNDFGNTVTWYSNRSITADSSIEDDSIFHSPPLFLAFLSILGLFVLYILFEAKRRQRIIEIIPPTTNNSLEFVETVGQLYYNKGDHKNLSEKMLKQYIEQLRIRYNLKWHQWDTEFANQLALRTNLSNQETQEFVSYIRYICDSKVLQEIDLRNLYFLLKKHS